LVGALLSGLYFIVEGLLLSGVEGDGIDLAVTPPVISGCGGYQKQCQHAGDDKDFTLALAWLRWRLWGRGIARCIGTAVWCAHALVRLLTVSW